MVFYSFITNKRCQTFIFYSAISQFENMKRDQLQIIVFYMFMVYSYECAYAALRYVTSFVYL